MSSTAFYEHSSIDKKGISFTLASILGKQLKGKPLTSQMRLVAPCLTNMHATRFYLVLSQNDFLCVISSRYFQLHAPSTLMTRSI